MNKLKAALAISTKFVDQHLPAILTGLAVVGLGGAVASAIKETPKAENALTNAKLDKAEAIEREAEDEQALDIYRDDEGHLLLSKIKLTPWEYVKTLFPIYWPTALITLSTGACIILSNRESAKRNAALLTALGMSEKSLKEYQEKVKELFGEKKEQQVRKEISKDRAMDAIEEDIIQTPNGTYLCCEPLTETYFRSSIVAVQQAVIRFNQKLMTEGVQSVADLCYELDIPLLDSWVADHLVWEYDANKKQMLEVTFDYGGNVRTHEPCLVLDYNIRPEWDR